MSGQSLIEKDLVVIGGGPGGYSAAFRAADLGRTVDLIDHRDVLGGVCLNEGCIPSKALLHATDAIRVAREAEDFGIAFGEAHIDFGRLRERTEKVIDSLTGGLAQIAARRKVSHTNASAHFIDAHSVVVKGVNVDEIWTFKQLIIATGSSPILLPGWPQDDRIWDAASALELREIPKHLVIVGGGIIGLEMACIYRGLGSKVTIIEATVQLAGGCDLQAALLLQKSLQARGCVIHTQTRVSGLRHPKASLVITCKNLLDDSTKGEFSIKASHVLQSVGRVANTESLQVANAGLTLDEKQQIVTDTTGQSSVTGIYAVGDVTGGPMLAHRAAHQGHIAAEACCGHPADWNDALVPSVAYTQPEVAWVGLSEEQARALNIDCESTTFPWAANGRSLAHGTTEGFTKLIYATDSQRLIGATLVGDNAGELVAGITQSIEMGVNLVDVAQTIHPHPTRSETIGMAAQLALGLCTDL